MENKKQKQSDGMVVVRGRDLPISPKKTMVVCKLLNNKKIDPSIKLLEDLVSQKKGIKMNKREVLKPGKGTKYPINVAKQLIKLLKSLNANASVKGIDTNKIILSAKADQAARPMKQGARLRQFKRAHVLIQGRVMEEKK